jgi:CubicO group peptidase (beta-lactamase class C family)
MRHFSRFIVLIIVLLTLTPMVSAPDEVTVTIDYWPTEEWQYTTPEEQGINSELLAEALLVIQKEDYDIDSMLVIRHGYIVADAYLYPTRQTTKHHLYSVTKSFISALTGIAIDEGYIAGVDELVLGFFPDRDFDNMDENKEAMTVEDLLTMQSGLTWTEGIPTYRAMYNSDDWVRFVLDAPMEREPGTLFLYHSGGSHILSAIIYETTEMNPSEYAEERLFEPLGIDAVWVEDSQGIANGGWGLHITPHDMAKFGFLYLHDGQWDGQQIVPAEWVEASTQDQIGSDYGYQWWIKDDGIYSAIGLYGQYIFVIPELDMIVVFTADMGDNAPDVISSLLLSYIIPAVEADTPLPEKPDGVQSLETLIEEVGSP